jgi:murein L,D-transpeptidase YafK
MSAGRNISRRTIISGLAAVAIAPNAFAADEAADFILVVKSARRLYLFRNGTLFNSYPIALGGDPVGPKRSVGDRRTPEGRYRIDGRNPDSRYHLALHISYPSERDLARAQAAGLDPGGDICLHGLPDGYEQLDPVAFDSDWTDGCIAVSDRAIEEIWAQVADGTPIEIIP